MIRKYFTTIVIIIENSINQRAFKFMTSKFYCPVIYFICFNAGCRTVDCDVKNGDVVLQLKVSTNIWHQHKMLCDQ